MENFYDNHDIQYENYIKDEKQSKLADSWLNLETLDLNIVSTTLKSTLEVFDK